MSSGNDYNWEMTGGGPEPQGSVTVESPPADFEGALPGPAPGGPGPTPVDSGGVSGGVDQNTLNQLYQQYLGRGVDPSGASTWAGQDINAVIAGITGSQEYANRGYEGALPSGPSGIVQPTGGTDLNALYQQYLGRNVDPSGAKTYAGWSAQDVINAIQGSPEYAARTSGGAQQPSDTTDINALYQKYLNRDVDPSGAATWAGKSADEIIAGITGSQEYQTAHPGAPVIIGPAATPGDPSTWEARQVGYTGGEESKPIYTYVDPKTGNVYDSQSADAKLLVSGQAANDKYIKSLDLATTNPEEAQRLYDLKTKNPTQFYDEVATKLKDQAFEQYWTNSGTTDAYDKLQTLKEVDPQAYYKNQLDFLAKQVGWQYGQNTSDRAAPVMEKIKQTAAEAQGAGVKYEDVKKIVDTGFSTANIQNQQRIANLAESGGTGFNFGKDIMPGVTMIAMAAATVASGGAAGTVGGAILGEAAAAAVGATATAAVGGAVIGAGMGALNAAVYNGNIGQGAIKGAISGAVGGAASGAIADMNATASGLVGSETIAQIADATNLSKQQVASIIVNTAATTVAAAATGQVNSSNFAQVFGTALASSSIGAYAENAARAIDPNVSNAAIGAVKSVAQIATTAALNGGSVQNAIMRNIPAIVSGAVAADASQQQPKFDPYATENVGLTSGAVDRTLQQGLIDPYVNAAEDPIAALNAQKNWTGNALDNIRYSTNTMIDQNMPKSDIISNLASIYNVDDKTAQNYYQNTLANNSFERLAAKAEDPIALLNAAKMLTGDKQENLKYVTDEMKRQGLSKSDVSSNLQDLFQVPKDKADAYANQLLSTQAEKKAVVQQAAAKATPAKITSSWDDTTTKIPAFPNNTWTGNDKIPAFPSTPISKTWEGNAPIPAFPSTPISPTWEDKSVVPRFDISTTWDDATKLQTPGAYTWDEAGKIPAFPEANFPSRLSAYVSEQAAPTIESIKAQIPTFDAVEKTFMDFVGKQTSPDQPNVLTAAKDVMNALVDVAKNAPQVAQMVIIKSIGDTVETFSTALISPLGRQNVAYLAGKAINDFAFNSVSPEMQDRIKSSVATVDNAIKNAEPGMKELTAVREYIKNPLAFVYRGGPEAVQDLGFLGISKLIGVASNVMTTFDVYKASLTADLALNYLDSALSGAGRAYDQLITKGTDKDTATTMASISGAMQGFVTMASHGVIDAAILKRLAGDVVDFTGKGIAAIGGGSYAASYIYTFINNVIDQKTVSPNAPIDWAKANNEAAAAAPISAVSSINAAVVSNFAPSKSEVTVSDTTNVPLLKAPEVETQAAEAPKLLQGPTRLLAGPEQAAAVKQAQAEVTSTLQQAGIDADKAADMANKTIGSELVNQINNNIPDGEAKLNPNKILGKDADGNPITFADVFGSLATDEPLVNTQTGSESSIKHNETLVKDIKTQLNNLLGVKLDENALTVQTQRAPEQQTTEEGLPFKEKPNLQNMFAAFDLTAPEVRTGLKGYTLPTTQTSTQIATAPETETQTKTQMQTVNPTTIAIATDVLPLVQPVTQTKTVMQPVNPTPIAIGTQVLDPTKLVTTIAPKSVIPPAVINPPIAVNPPEVTTTTITPNVPVVPSKVTPKLPTTPAKLAATIKKKKINPPDLFADFARGRKLALPLEKLQQIINMNQPSNVIPMENYINPLLKQKTLEEELKAAKEGGLMHLATGGGTGGSSAGATPGSNIGIGPGDMAYSPVANFVKGSATKPFLPEQYNLQMFNYTPTPFNPETALKQILAAAEGGAVHMAEGGESVDPGPEVRVKGQKFSYRTPFTPLNNMVNAPRVYNEGGEVEGHNPQFFSEGGLNSMQHSYVKGDGDGTSDSIPAMLANGEFVIPADVVSALGNGSNDSGASVLDEFLKTIRAHKTRAGKKGLPPDSKGALGYLLEAKRKVKA